MPDEHRGVGLGRPRKRPVDSTRRTTTPSSQFQLSTSSSPLAVPNVASTYTPQLTEYSLHPRLRRSRRARGPERPPTARTQQRLEESVAMARGRRSLNAKYDSVARTYGRRALSGLAPARLDVAARQRRDADRAAFLERLGIGPAQLAPTTPNSHAFHVHRSQIAGTTKATRSTLAYPVLEPGADIENKPEQWVLDLMYPPETKQSPEEVASLQQQQAVESAPAIFFPPQMPVLPQLWPNTSATTAVTPATPTSTPYVPLWLTPHGVVDMAGRPLHLPPPPAPTFPAPGQTYPYAHYADAEDMRGDTPSPPQAHTHAQRRIKRPRYTYSSDFDDYYDDDYDERYYSPRRRRRRRRQYSPTDSELDEEEYAVRCRPSRRHRHTAPAFIGEPEKVFDAAEASTKVAEDESSEDARNEAFSAVAQVGASEDENTWTQHSTPVRDEAHVAHEVWTSAVPGQSRKLPPSTSSTHTPRRLPRHEKIPAQADPPSEGLRASSSSSHAPPRLSVHPQVPTTTQTPPSPPPVAANDDRSGIRGTRLVHVLERAADDWPSTPEGDAKNVDRRLIREKAQTVSSFTNHEPTARHANVLPTPPTSSLPPSSAARAPSGGVTKTAPSSVTRDMASSTNSSAVSVTPFTPGATTSTPRATRAPRQHVEEDALPHAEPVAAASHLATPGSSSSTATSNAATPARLQRASERAWWAAAGIRAPASTGAAVETVGDEGEIASAVYTDEHVTAPTAAAAAGADAEADGDADDDAESIAQFSDEGCVDAGVWDAGWAAVNDSAVRGDAEEMEDIEPAPPPTPTPPPPPGPLPHATKATKKVRFALDWDIGAEGDGYPGFRVWRDGWD